MKPSEELASFIKGWEKCRLEPYRDQAGLWTVGWGHLLPQSAPRLPWTQEQADAQFLADLTPTGEGVSRMLKVQCAQNQYDAMVSLAFNIGLQAFLRSTLLAMVNMEKFEDAAEWFAPWNRVTISGARVESKGLTLRRAAERAIFIHGDYSGRP